MPDWAREYATLSAADGDGGLPAEDLERLALAAFLLGRDEEVVTLHERAHEAYLDRALTERAAECAFWLGFHLDQRGDVAQASGWAARLKRLVPDGGSRLDGRLRSRDANGLLASGAAGEALVVFDDASGTAAAWGDEDGLALAGLGRSRCLAVLGRRPEAMEALDEVMVRVVGGRVAPPVAGIAYCAVVAASLAGLDLRRAEEWTRAFAAWVDGERGMRVYRATCLVHRAQLLQVRGAWAEAEAEVRLAVETSGTSADESALGEAHYRAAELERVRGHVGAAESAYARAAAHGAEVQPGLGLLRLTQHRPDAAGAGLDRALAEVRIERPRALLLAARVEVALAVGDTGGASRRADELAGLAAATPTPFVRALAEHAAGAVLLAGGDAAAALPRLRGACSAWREIDAPFEAARTGLLIARACGELGDDDARRMELAAALAVFVGLGAAPELVAAAASDEADDGPLTPREREVLRLLATGASNHDIAQRLVLSQKTVARHVSNIFGKLDVTSRAAATAFAFRHGLA